MSAPATTWTVAELIARLQAFDQTLPVYIDDADTEWWLPLGEERDLRVEDGALLIRSDYTRIL